MDCGIYCDSFSVGGTRLWILTSFGVLVVYVVYCPYISWAHFCSPIVRVCGRIFVSMEESKEPVSTIDKWLHYDKNYTRGRVSKLLGKEPTWYFTALHRPYKYFSVEDMERIAVLVDRSVITVFWACWLRPRKEIGSSERDVNLLRALERLGIERDV